MNNSDNNTRTVMLNAIAVGLAIVCLVVCLIDWFQVSGSKYGMFYGVFVDPPTFGFVAHGPNYFQSINIWYFVISICLAVFLAAKLFGRSPLAVATRIFALCVAVFPFINMLTFKYDVMTVEWHYEWLEVSIYLDWACLMLMAAIMCLEFISQFSRTHNSEKPLLEL